MQHFMNSEWFKYFMFLFFLGIVKSNAESIDTTVNYLYSTPAFTSNQSDSIYRDLKYRIANKKYSIEKDFYYLFRFRDAEYLSMWKRVQ